MGIHVNVMKCIQTKHITLKFHFFLLIKKLPGSQIKQIFAKCIQMQMTHFDVCFYITFIQ